MAALKRWQKHRVKVAYSSRLCLATIPVDERGEQRGEMLGAS